MKERDIIITAIPQADGSSKNRPAILLREMPSFGDMLICGISTQLHQEIKGFDEIISPQDSDFRSSGLTSVSLIRLSNLVVLPKSKIKGSIGAISTSRHERLLKNLSTHLTKHIP